jgi:hypothetical protein
MNIMTDLEVIATQLLARDDIADLRATRDAIELADLLIWTAPEAIYALIQDHEPISHDDYMIPALRATLTGMIESPND